MKISQLDSSPKRQLQTTHVYYKNRMFVLDIETRLYLCHITLQFYFTRNKALILFHILLVKLLPYSRNIYVFDIIISWKYEMFANLTRRWSGVRITDLDETLG